jgi:hypothetical protein
VPFSPIFFAQISFGKRHFSPFFANNKAPFFAAFRSEKKNAIFGEKFREKQARPNSQPKTGPFFAAFRTAKSTIFRHFSLREKSTVFRFAKKIAKSRLDPSAHVVAVGKPGMGSGDFNPLF